MGQLELSNLRKDSNIGSFIKEKIVSKIENWGHENSNMSEEDFKQFKEMNSTFAWGNKEWEFAEKGFFLFYNKTIEKEADQNKLWNR